MARKLIEVALPLEEINAAAAREKSIRHGHPSTLHLWWARRPLAAARAVIFASLITDPGDPDYPWRSGDSRDVERERERLHRLIVDLVRWENSTNEAVIGQARAEIMRHTNGNPPPLLDPFAGGGSIPLEAQRLGLEAHASDLNPVAVLINKAMIEIPPKFAGLPPVSVAANHLNHRGRSAALSGSSHEITSATTHAPLPISTLWKGAAGLAEDVRHYGTWMRDEAERRIGHLYPRVTLPPEDGGGEATVIAWLWARTVTCPNPACGAEMPLITSFALSKKKGKEKWLQPNIVNGKINFEIHDQPSDSFIDPNKGYKRGMSGIFECAFCHEVTTRNYVSEKALTGRLGTMPLAVVADGVGGRIYLSSAYTEPTYMESFPEINKRGLEVEFSPNPRDLWCRNFGLKTPADLFTERQLVALTTFSDLVGEARERVLADAVGVGRPVTGVRLADGGDGAEAYADAVATYLAFAVDRMADRGSTITGWDSSRESIRNTFGRQAIPMIWDFAEGNPFSESAGNFNGATEWIGKVVSALPANRQASAIQNDATSLQHTQSGYLVSTDPPYYDNIGYADLSDFFYVWLRRALIAVWPNEMATLLAPKAEELVATPYRFTGGKAEAEAFFEAGLRSAFAAAARIQHPDYPTTVYYAFKQAETRMHDTGQHSTASTGWETMLEGLIMSGYQITGTWPMRTEMANRSIASGTNALASSIVLACRVRPDSAPETTRQHFLREMRAKIAEDLRPLQRANIAPVDLAQAAIGPGMAIYSRYSRVREASGESLTVREALTLINQVLDEVLADQDAEYDSATGWAITWFEQYGMNDGPYGDAEGLARARNVAVDELARAGIVRSGHGNVRLARRWEIDESSDRLVARASELTVWEALQWLVHTVQHGQEAAATIKRQIDAAAPGRTDLTRDLAYRLNNIADRKGWNQEALLYNTLVQNWADIEHLAGKDQTTAFAKLLV